MATFQKFNAFVENLAEKVHNLGSDTLKVMLTNTAPVSRQRLHGGRHGCHDLVIRADLGHLQAGSGGRGLHRVGRLDRAVSVFGSLQRHADVSGRPADRVLGLRLVGHIGRWRDVHLGCR
jgi:hypothetical protein